MKNDGEKGILGDSFVNDKTEKLTCLPCCENFNCIENKTFQKEQLVRLKHFL